jgi:hypothetical protein
VTRPENSDPEQEAVRRQFDWAETRPSQAVIETVAEALDRSPTTFGPLFEYVDPDALNALFGSEGRVVSDEYTTVSFLFATLDVTVRSDGTVTVQAEARSVG